MGGGSPIPGHVLAPVSALRRSVLSWWSYRSAAFPPTSVIFFPSSSAAADRQSDGNKSAVHKTSLNFSLYYVHFANSATPFPHVCYPGHHECDALDPAISYLGSITSFGRVMFLFFFLNELRFHRIHRCSFLDNTCISALSPWIRFTQRRR